MPGNKRAGESNFTDVPAPTEGAPMLSDAYDVEDAAHADALSTARTIATDYPARPL